MRCCGPVAGVVVDTGAKPVFVDSVLVLLHARLTSMSALANQPPSLPRL